MDLYDQRGHRKYLTSQEWRAFLQAAANAAPEINTFCQTLAYSGCRISEALALTADRVDIGDAALIIRSLKKRERVVFRAIPVPDEYLDLLAAKHHLPRVDGSRLWTFSRATAWRRITDVMEAAGIQGMHATPRGLRHGFGIRAVGAGVPLNLTQKWLGHADIATTAIYANALGDEERNLARRMWA
jgi:integrase